MIGCIEKESILGKDISTCLPVSLNNSRLTFSLCVSVGTVLMNTTRKGKLELVLALDL